MYDDSKSAQRRAEIEAAIRDLPIFPENEWQVRLIVDELCLRADIIAASKGDGRAPPHFRPATRQMTMNELRQLRRRFFDLARKVERGGVKTKRARERLKRAREQLARLIEGLHAPTIEALNDAPALMVGGRPRLAVIRHIEKRLPKKPLEDSDLSALGLRYRSAVARAAEIQCQRIESGRLRSRERHPAQRPSRHVPRLAAEASARGATIRRTRRTPPRPTAASGR